MNNIIKNNNEFLNKTTAYHLTLRESGDGNVKGEGGEREEGGEGEWEGKTGVLMVEGSVAGKGVSETGCVSDSKRARMYARTQVRTLTRKMQSGVRC